MVSTIDVNKIKATDAAADDLSRGAHMDARPHNVREDRMVVFAE